MAFGGWIQAQGNVFVSGYDDGIATQVEDTLNQIIAPLGTLAGWTITKSATQHVNYANIRHSFHAIVTHTSNASVCVVLNGDMDSRTCINNGIGRNGTTGANNDGGLYIAYQPAATGPFDPARTPLDTLLSPDIPTMFKFITLGDSYPGTTGGDEVTWLARGGDVMFTYTPDVLSRSEVQQFGVWGEILDNLVHDPTDTTKTGAVYFLGQPSYGDTPEIDFMTAAGTQRLQGGRVTGYDATFSGTYKSHGVPWNRIQYLVRVADVATLPVHDGDGFKGVVSDEVLFITNQGSATPKQTWLGDGVNRTHINIGRGFWIGWDESNDDWF